MAFDADLGCQVNFTVSKSKPLRKPPTIRNKSKRKLKRENYALFLKTYKRSRRKAFQRLFNTSSLSAELTTDTVFQFWNHFLTRDSICHGALDDKYHGDSNECSELLDIATVDEVRKAWPPT